MFRHENKNYYPTPPELINKMLAKIKGNPGYILEPSAGKGDLLKATLNKFSDRWHTPMSACIEIDPDLQATLRGAGHNLIDTDFLSYTGQDKFDLIIGNGPFDHGDLHLLKAIDIMYRGQIIFILNAETLKKPHTKTRKLLVKKLDQLGAKIEYIQKAFTIAERKTNVEIALIDIVIERKIEDDLFAGCKDKDRKVNKKIQDKHEVSVGKSIPEMVAEYNELVRIGTETLFAYYRNYNKIGGYLTIKDPGKPVFSVKSGDDLTATIQEELNNLIWRLRIDFWRGTLKLDAVQKRMTRKKSSEFEEGLKKQCMMDFTEANIRQFVLNIIGSAEQTLTEATVDIFEMFTTRHCYRGDVNDENIHYFNGWKTNNAYKVKERVIVPGARYSSSFFCPIMKRWSIDYDTCRLLDDIDKVMNYFDGMEEYISMSSALLEAFKRRDRADRQTGIESTYFIITAHKKGTVHLKFRDNDVLRRFNVTACRGKNWLPEDYGTKKYADMPQEEKVVVDAFEGKEVYAKNVSKPLFKIAGHQFQIGYQKAA